MWLCYAWGKWREEQRRLPWSSGLYVLTLCLTPSLSHIIFSDLLHGFLLLWVYIRCYYIYKITPQLNGWWTEWIWSCTVSRVQEFEQTGLDDSWVACKVIAKMPARDRVTFGIALSRKVALEIAGDSTTIVGCCQEIPVLATWSAPSGCSSIPTTWDACCPQTLTWRREQAVASHTCESMKSCALLLIFLVLWTKPLSMWNGRELGMDPSRAP